MSRLSVRHLPDLLYSVTFYTQCPPYFSAICLFGWRITQTVDKVTFILEYIVVGLTGHYKGDQMLQFCGTAQHFGPLIPPSESKSLVLIGCSIQKLAVHGRHFSKIWPLTAVKKAERLSSWVICRITCHFLTKINMNIMEVTTCEMQQDWKSAYK